LLLNGWRYARKRNNALKLHPLLIPYSQLPSEEREKDLCLFTGRKPTKNAPETPDYIERLKDVGFRIEFPPATVAPRNRARSLPEKKKAER
jgi:hypothetical protein